VQDVVAGKKRTGRLRGAGGLLGSDGSDDSEDDEEARALRQRLAKRRRVEGDTLDALARNPATASFHATYQMALVDDAEEFAHLDRDQDVELDPDQGRDHEQDQDQGEGEGSAGDEGDGDDRGEGSEDRVGDGDVEMTAPSSSNLGKKEISAAEVRKALQEVARGERVRPALTFKNFNLSLLTRHGVCAIPVGRNTARLIRRTCPGWTKIWTWTRQTQQTRCTSGCA
jgi:MRC1-like domain